MKYNIAKTGFTMIELLLVMAIFSIIMTGVYKVFQSQHDSYIVQEEVAAMQQNIRPSMFMIAKEARMAGTYLGSENGWVESFKVHNNYVGGTFKSGADIVDIIYASFTTKSPLDPKENGKFHPATSANTLVDPSFSVKVDGGCPPLNGDGEYQECFEDQQLIIISDGVNSNFLMITQEPSVNGIKAMVQHNPGAQGGGVNIPANKTWPNMGNDVPNAEKGYNNAGSYLMKVVYISFAIKETVPGHPSFSYCADVKPNDPLDTRQYDPVADNVEDLQIALILRDGREVYSANDNADGLTALDNYDADLTNDTDDIRAIRISIVARSDRQLPNIKGAKPASEDSTAGNADHYMRRTHTMQVQLRNFGLWD